MADVFPGLRGRIRDRFGDAKPLRDLGHHFGDWLERGQHANPATVARVETTLARYLSDAANVGRLWGTVVGAVGGSGVVILIAVVAWVWQVTG